MRIGIITLGFHYNYGGILQAYAMQMTLNGLGHKAYVIGYSNRSMWRIFLGNMKWKLSKIIRKPKNVMDKISTFPLYHIPMKYFPSYEYIKESSFDGYVVGSDQVWRKEFILDFSLSFLLFTEGWKVKRVAYAPSFGPAEWTYGKKATSIIKKSLLTFDGLSTRERSGSELCEKHLGLKAKVVLDPTLMAPLSVFTKFVNHSKKEFSLPFVYFVKRNLASVDIEKMMRKLGESAFSHVYLPYEGYDCGVLPSVEEWLSHIHHAKFVFTDSFHACVFCILFHTPFIIMPNQWGGNSRFDSLLKPLGLESRIVSSEMTNVQDVLWHPVDWVKVDKKLNELRHDSASFLEKALM